MISAIVAGQEYALDTGVYCYYMNELGTGMFPIHRLSERGPQQSGDTDRGWYPDPRFFQLLLEVTGDSRPDLYDRRQTLIRIFRPKADPMSIKWVLNTTYLIDAEYVGDMDMPTTDQRGFNQKIVVTLKASDPTFYVLPVETITFQMGAGSDTFPVPMSVPHQVGASTLNMAVGFAYYGTADSLPIIRIYGPITNPIITDNLTGDKLDFTGTTITGGDYYEIDLRYGHKTVVDSSGVNKISTLTDDSDLSTFHLTAPEDASDHWDNSISVSGSSATTTTQIELIYYRRFVGK